MRSTIRLLPFVAGAFLAGCATHFDLQGHRGARGLAPENTLPAFAKALEVGVATLELDTGITRDGVVVVGHDSAPNPDIARLDGNWLAAKGPPIHELTYAELQERRALIAKRMDGRQKDTAEAIGVKPIWRGRRMR